MERRRTAVRSTGSLYRQSTLLQLTSSYLHSAEKAGGRTLWLRKSKSEPLSVFHENLIYER